MPAKNLALAALMTLALSSCAHAWPPEAHGGMAERDKPQDADMRYAVDRMEHLRSTPNQHPPAQLAEAQERMIRAQRERAGGLTLDAHASFLDALDALGAGPDAGGAPQARPRRAFRNVK